MLRIYSIHAARDDQGRLVDLRAVRDGFSWGAAVFTFLWAFWRRLWLEGAALLILPPLVLNLLFAPPFRLPGDAIAWLLLSLALFLAVGLWAAPLQRAALARRGYRLTAWLAAPGAAAALQLYALRRRLASDQQPEPPRQPPQKPEQPQKPPRQPA